MGRSNGTRFRNTAIDQSPCSLVAMMPQDEEGGSQGLPAIGSIWKVTSATATSGRRNVMSLTTALLRVPRKTVE